VLENGRARESGTHEELSLRGGRYHEMLKAQLHLQADQLAETPST
jgi:ABC-type multidrug transport system fused ATPase/permease subunit